MEGIGLALRRDQALDARSDMWFAVPAGASSGNSLDGMERGETQTGQQGGQGEQWREEEWGSSLKRVYKYLLHFQLFLVSLH